MAIIKSTLLFASGTLISRVFGLVRELVLAHTFGAGLAMDAFLLANRIPNMLREMLAEGALGSSFTRVFSYLSANEPQKAERLYRDSLYLFAWLGVIISILGVLFAPYLVMLMTSFGPDGTNLALQKEATGLTRVVFPFIGFMILASISAGVLQQKGHFLWSAVAPIALNVSYIFAALVMAPFFAQNELAISAASNLHCAPEILGLSVGVVLGGALQFLVQDLFLRWRYPALAEFSLRLKNRYTPEVARVIAMTLPMTIATSSGLINVLVSTNFAATLESGAITWLNYSFRLWQLPVGIFAVAVGSAILPDLTRTIALAKGNFTEEVYQKLTLSLELVVWLLAPCFTLLLWDSTNLIRLLFQHGRYDEYSAFRTAEALYYYSFGLFGYGLVKVLTSFYYAIDRTSFAMRVSLLGILINFLANYFFVHIWGANGIAFSSSVVLSVNALLLFLGLPFFGVQVKIRRFLPRFAIAIAAALSCYMPLMMLEEIIPEIGDNWRLRLLLLVVLKSVCVFFVFGIAARLCFGKGMWSLLRWRTRRSK